MTNVITLAAIDNLGSVLAPQIRALVSEYRDDPTLNMKVEHINPPFYGNIRSKREENNSSSVITLIIELYGTKTMFGINKEDILTGVSDSDMEAAMVLVVDQLKSLAISGHLVQSGFMNKLTHALILKDKVKVNEILTPCVSSDFDSSGSWSVTIVDPEGEVKFKHEVTQNGFYVGQISTHIDTMINCYKSALSVGYFGQHIPIEV